MSGYAATAHVATDTPRGAEPSSDEGIPAILVRPEEAARLLRLSRTAVYGLMRTGELDSIKIGHRRRVPLSACHEWVARRRAAQASASAESAPAAV